MNSVIERSATIFVAGHRGMVGGAIVRRLQALGYGRVVTRTRQELNLLEQAQVHEFMHAVRPDYVFIAAAKVGGIQANNSERADFLQHNLVLQSNLIGAAHAAGVQRLMFLGSSCIYPRDCPQPIREDYLLTGPLEPTNEPYAIAKIAGIKLCEGYNRQYGRQYTSVMPTNLYGPGDNYDLATSHVLPALLRKAHEAKARGDAELVVWGSGAPRREFLYVDDLAEACVMLMEQGYDGPLVNIGCGEDLTIRELAEQVMRCVGFAGRIVFDASSTSRAPRRWAGVPARRWPKGCGRPTPQRRSCCRRRRSLPDGERKTTSARAAGQRQPASHAHPVAPRAPAGPQGRPRRAAPRPPCRTGGAAGGDVAAA